MKRKNKQRKMKMPEINATIKGTRHKELDSIKSLLNNGSSKGFSELVRYTKKYPEDPYGERLLGIILLRRGDYKGAREAFIRVINAHGKNEHNGLIGLSQTYYQEKNLDKARIYLKKAIENNPYNELTSYLYLASLESECQNYYQALNVLYSALELKNTGINTTYDKSDVKLQIARTLLFMERHEEADDILQSISPNSKHQTRELSYNKAIVYKQKGQAKEAIEQLEESRKTDKKDDLYYIATFEQARMYKQLGMLDESLAILEELSTENVLFDGSVPFSIGMIRLSQKDYDGAKNFLQEAITSSDYKTRNYAVYYYSALKYLSGNKEEAEKILASSVTKEKIPFHVNCLTLMRMLYDQERYQDAMDYLKLVRNKDQNIDDNIDFRRMEILIAKKQGKNFPPIRETSYLEGQIVNYNMEEAMNYDENNAIKEGYTYATQDVEALYEEILPLLTEDNKLMPRVLDEYKIPNPNIIMYNGISAENLRVLTLPGTKDILAISIFSERLLPTFGELRGQKGKQKSKSSDAISRFNARLAKSTAKI